MTDYENGSSDSGHCMPNWGWCDDAAARSWPEPDQVGIETLEMAQWDAVSFGLAFLIICLAWLIGVLVIERW
jgi:hypothetical protein